MRVISYTYKLHPMKNPDGWRTLCWKRCSRSILRQIPSQPHRLCPPTHVVPVFTFSLCLPTCPQALSGSRVSGAWPGARRPVTWVEGRSPGSHLGALANAYEVSEQVSQEQLKAGAACTFSLPIMNEPEQLSHAHVALPTAEHIADHTTLCPAQGGIWVWCLRTARQDVWCTLGYETSHLPTAHRVTGA
jgi:hypothetical protein